MNEWVVQTYMSGTHIVTRNMIDEPHYYVYADKRYQVCCELRDWLNGKIKEPDWLKSLQYHPNTKETCIGEDGIDIAATGPMILPPDDNGVSGHDCRTWSEESMCPIVSSVNSDCLYTETLELADSRLSPNLSGHFYKQCHAAHLCSKQQLND